MTRYETFVHLHQKGKPILLGNAWDAASARLLESNGLEAIGTSSAAIANIFGYGDGEEISFRELLVMVERIFASIQVPLSVDMEKGYGEDTGTIISNIEKLIETGAVGINIEDSSPVKGSGELVAQEIFSRKLTAIKDHLEKNNLKLFINARTDAYLVNVPSPFDTTIERIKWYENAGADGIFVPFVTEIETIRKITAATKLPVNVLSAPGLPSLDALSEAGVSRVSLGSSLFRATYRHAERMIQQVVKDRAVRSLFG
jgi:2-methylisocitrate lyase-like PEP mutase family enzyme